ncbi:MAG TPA: YetF domain-containing protein [Acidimicrobiales bacterium]|nr:YetF domain-containing protein [Acidimicrobiales bacterium]
MFFDRWSDVVRVVVLGAAAYAVMVVVLRVSGKRTLAKLNAFDLVVTVALGSVLATIALSSDVSLTEGVVAIAVLVVAQWAVSWASVRTSLARRLVRAEATVVFDHGRFDDKVLSRARLTSGEVCQAIRSSGCGDLEMVAAVVLETDGSLSVVTVDRCRTASAMPATTSASLLVGGAPLRSTERETGTSGDARRRSEGGDERA